jgi:transcriptional regulator with XRE-family HTH domain
MKARKWRASYLTRKLAGFGGRMQRWRRKRGLTQDELAVVSGVSQGHISRLERGVSDVEGLTVLSVLKIAQALEVSPKVLLGIDLNISSRR